MINPNLLILPFSKKGSAKNKSYLVVVFNQLRPNGAHEIITSKPKLIRILHNLNLFHNKYVCDVNTATYIKDITSDNIDYFTSKPDLIRAKSSKHIADYILKKTLLKGFNLSSFSDLKNIRNIIKKYNFIPFYFCTTSSTKNIVHGCSIKLVRLLSDTTFFAEHFKRGQKKWPCSYFSGVNKLKNPQDLLKKRPSKPSADLKKHRYSKMNYISSNAFTPLFDNVKL